VSKTAVFDTCYRELTRAATAITGLISPADISSFLGGWLRGRSKLKDRVASRFADELIHRGVWRYIEGASKDESAHGRRQARTQDFLEHGPGLLWGQLHGSDRLSATAVGKDSFARRAQITHPVRVAPTVGSD